MNSNAESTGVLLHAIVFVVLFIIGGVMGTFSLPDFNGRFYISGFVFAVFGVGLGRLFLQAKNGG